ncbi:MAG: GIY-YIG nuclease family protein [Candidatus Lariskella arthropodorum]
MSTEARRAQVDGVVRLQNYALCLFLELSNSNIYVGFSSNLKQRFQAHNDGKLPATAGFLNAKLKSYVAV